MASQYQAIYDNWKNDPEGFWGKLAEKIDWIKAPDANFDPKMGYQAGGFQVEKRTLAITPLIAMLPLETGIGWH